jgi:hypothetical protein
LAGAGVNQAAGRIRPAGRQLVIAALDHSTTVTGIHLSGYNKNIYTFFSTALCYFELGVSYWKAPLAHDLNLKVIET